MDAERGGCVALVCGSCSVPIREIVVHRSIAILSPTLDVTSAPNAPIPSAIRRVCNGRTKKKIGDYFEKNILEKSTYNSKWREINEELG